MSMYKFGLPVILSSRGLGDDDGEGDVIGGGSAQGGIGGNGGNKTPFACSFDTWSEKFRSDTYKDGLIDFNDYGQWWADSGLDMEAWEQFNSGIPFNWKANKDH